ncbi:TIGR04013 family B12-binding domain/radical SAM domain-containing protein [bacterium]|nr:TIGR04013 family B12-binding domain/radical SAM domain-containing protein [bacterium]
MRKQLKSLIFNRNPGNRFSIPVLLSSIEKRGLEKSFSIRVADDLCPDSVPDEAIVAFSFQTVHLPEVRADVRRFRKKAGIRLIAGGPHATGDPENTLKLGFDAVFQGDGEIILPDFLETLAGSGKWPEKQIFRADPLDDLEQSLPFSGMDPFIPPIEIMRGCGQACRFCQTRGRKPVYRPMDSVRLYLKEIRRRNMLLRLGFICPDGFGYKQEGLETAEAVEMLLAESRSMGIRFLEYGIFPSEVRPNHVTPQLLAVVREYCSNRKITVGAQSGSERVLRQVCRGHGRESIEKAAGLIREAGFKPQLDFIIGFPGETEDDRLETLEFMRRMGTRYGAWNQVHYFLPLSGTPYYGMKPSAISASTVRKLDRLASAGLANDWWKKGLVLSRKIVETLEEMERNE